MEERFIKYITEKIHCSVQIMNTNIFANYSGVRNHLSRRNFYIFRVVILKLWSFTLEFTLCSSKCIFIHYSLRSIDFCLVYFSMQFFYLQVIYMPAWIPSQPEILKKGLAVHNLITQALWEEARGPQGLVGHPPRSRFSERPCPRRMKQRVIEHDIYAIL